MVKVINGGQYKLVKNRKGSRVLFLDGKAFHFESGEISATQYENEADDTMLCKGEYRIIDVVGENKLTNQTHLELWNSASGRQGFLLVNGLPTERDGKKVIKPTREKIEYVVGSLAG